MAEVPPAEGLRVGVISDTHGLLRPKALEALAGCDHILHAGDVGSDEILPALQNIAPVTAVRGNIDTGGLCGSLPLTEAVEIGGALFYLVHRREDLDLNPRAASVHAVIFGHSHAPEIAWEGGVLYFNPGSAGARRFRLPVSIGLIDIVQGKLLPRIHTLDV